MVALGRLCFSCSTGASGALGAAASVPFVPCCLPLLCICLGGWGGEFAGDGSGVSTAGDAGGVSAADDAGDVGAVGGAGAFVLILTLMQSYMGRPSLKSTGAFVVVLVVVLCAS